MELDDKSQILNHLKKYGFNSFSSVLAYGNFHCYFLTQTEGFFGYLDSKKMAVAIGEPVCAVADYRIATKEFIELCERQGKACVFAVVGEKFCSDVRDLDFEIIKIGDDFIFDVSSYAPRGNRAMKIRSARNNSLHLGVVIKEYAPNHSQDEKLEREFLELADRWLKARPKINAFLMELRLFERRDLKRYFYAELGGKLVALMTCLPIYARNGFLFEDVIRDPKAPRGAIELMVLETLKKFKEENKSIATFGISPRVEATNLKGWPYVIARLAITFSNRILKLQRLYHSRKKYSTGISESVYLLKHRKGVGLRDIYYILTFFNTLDSAG